MNKQNTLFKLICIFSFFANLLTAQDKPIRIGLAFNPMMTFHYITLRPPALNFSTGVFGHYNFSKKSGIGIGLEYQKQDLNTLDNILCRQTRQTIPVATKDRFNLFRVPIWYSRNMNYKPDTKIKTKLVVGYTFGKLLNSNQAEENYGLKELVSNINFGFIGFEVNKNIFKDIQIATGIHLEATSIYHARYGLIYNSKFVIKIYKSFAEQIL